MKSHILQAIENVEASGYTVIDTAELTDLLGRVRELAEGFGKPAQAAEESIQFIDDALGNPGQGE